ncbi:MAG: hypothetical protein QNJ51_03790 [Calothrix sp. MO_167.B12]|nr:hypothetical protein [Calothrix sp. MO_167.B12]
MFTFIDNKNYSISKINYLIFFLRSLLQLDADKTKSVIILCAPRTGSTLISSYLDSLNEFKSYGEVLNPELYPFIEKLNKLPFKRNLSLLKIKFILADNNASVKLIFSQCEKLGVNVNDLEKNFPFVKFVIIYRSSLIDSYISYQRAKKTNEWFTTKNTNSQKLSFRIDKDDFLNYCRRTKKLYYRCNSEALLNRSMVVEYQKLSTEPQKLFQEEICPFLDITYTPVKSSLRKQIVTPLSELIENFDDISELINSPDTLLQFDRSAGGFY